MVEINSEKLSQLWKKSQPNDELYSLGWPDILQKLHRTGTPPDIAELNSMYAVILHTNETGWRNHDSNVTRVYALVPLRHLPLHDGWRKINYVARLGRTNDRAEHQAIIRDG